MKKLIIVLLLALSACATDASRLYDANRLAANPNYLDESNASTRPSENTPKDYSNARLFACLLRYSAYLNQADARFVCQ